MIGGGRIKPFGAIRAKRPEIRSREERRSGRHVQDQTGGSELVKRMDHKRGACGQRLAGLAACQRRATVESEAARGVCGGL